jgi:hypothetical protein
LGSVVLILGSHGAAAAAPRKKRVRDKPYPEVFLASVAAEVKRRAKELAHALSTNRAPLAWPPGERALATLALLRAGWDASKDPVKTQLASLRTESLSKTYTVAATMLALAAPYEGRSHSHVSAEDKAYLQRGAAFLLEAQVHWDDKRRASGPRKKKTGFGPVPTTPSRTPVKAGWGYGLAPDTPDVPLRLDVSNTQYALLGLRAAARCGIRIPDTAWRNALRFLLAWQDRQGKRTTLRANEVSGEWRTEWTTRTRARGFAYSGPAHGGVSVTSGRTCAGVGGLMICSEMLAGNAETMAALQEKARSAILDGLAWLQENYSVRESQGDRRAVYQTGSITPDLDRWYGAYMFAL